MPKFQIICIAVIISPHIFHRTLAFLSAKGEQFSQRAPQHPHHTFYAVCGTSLVCFSLFKLSQKSNSSCIDFSVSFITSVAEGFTMTN